MKRCMLMALTAVLLLAFPCHGAPKKAPIASVDVQVLLTESTPGKEGVKHLERVRAILENGFDDLKTAHKDEPQPKRDQIIAEGLAVLNRQMAIEQAAVNQALMAMLAEEAEKWRKANGVSLVLPRHIMIAGDWPTIDCTRAILGAANRRVVKFAKLPVVTLKNRNADKNSGGQP